MGPFDQELSQRLKALRQQGLYRELHRIDSPQGTALTRDGIVLANYSSNDYLGLANHPSLKEAAIRAVERYGAGSGSARLICGSLAPHHQLEETLAAFKGTPAALVFSTGYATAVGTIGAVMEKGDIIIIDKLAHACIVDGARLSGAKLRVFAHNDLNDLESILQWAAQQTSIAHGKHSPRILIATESIFSMDGDACPLRELVALKERYGAWLMIDEAHATGLLGPQRRGLADALGVSDRIEIQMGTLGKAVGASGGYICGSRALIDYLVNRARSFIFSTAPLPATAAAAQAGMELIQSAEGQQRCAQLWRNVERVGEVLSKPALHAKGQVPMPPQTAILPLMVGDESKAVDAATWLREHGVLIPAVRYPTVARGEARLRLTLTADHTPEQLILLLQLLHASPLQTPLP